jgi:cytochrome c oxidase assembly protein Cox11
VDTGFASDPDTRPLSELTLSYTLFPAPDAKDEPLPPRAR